MQILPVIELGSLTFFISTEIFQLKAGLSTNDLGGFPDNGSIQRWAMMGEKKKNAM